MSRWWEETQLYILTNILTWNEPACLARRLNLTWVSNVCEAAPIFLFWAPNGLNESWTRRTFRIFFHLESSSFPGFSPTHPTEERTMGTRLVLSRKSTMAFLTGQSWRVVKSWYGWGPQNKDFGAVAQTAQPFGFVCGAGYQEASQLRDSFQNIHQYRQTSEGHEYVRTRE